MSPMSSESPWFRWLVLGGIGLGMAAIVIGFLRATFP
jgi:hypothetical protein